MALYTTDPGTCGDCKRSISNTPVIGNINGYKSPRDITRTAYGEVMNVRECRACYRKAFVEVYPQYTCPVGSRLK